MIDPPARKACHEALAAAERAYREALAPARKAYHEALAAAERAYRPAPAPARKAHRESNQPTNQEAMTHE